MKQNNDSYITRFLSLLLVVLMVGCSSENSDKTTIQLLIDDASNPYEMHFVSDTKAYILRYGSPSVWIVDPSVTAADEENFKIGEINLGAYDADGIPNMSAGIMVNDKLYIVMQAMDASFIPGEAYMAVIDTTTDTEIVIGTNPLKGFRLSVKSPVDIDVEGDFVYVTGVGRYGSSTRDPEYTGGVEKISLVDFSSSLLVDDGDELSSPYGQISGLTIISATQAYFTAYSAWQSVSLYGFDLSTGTVNSTPITGYDGVDIRSMEISPEGYLWLGLGSFTNPVIDILDPLDESLVDSIALDRNPIQIRFNTTTAAIVGVASDFGSSAIYLADASSPYSVDQGNAEQDLSDIVAAIDENSFYRLGRSSQHSVSKFDITSPSVLEWQFSTNSD